MAALDVLGTDDLQLLWLPLAHSFGKVLLAAQLSCGFASAIDGRLDAIADNCAEVRPTFMAGVPRVFEKAHSRLLTTAQSRGDVRTHLLARALHVAKAVGNRRRAGTAVPLRLRAEHALWDRLVLAKLRNVFGGRIRFFVCGSAALNREIEEWFLDAGMLILEGYGLTETSGGASINTPSQYKLGTVGRPLPGTQVRIGADDEIQILGPNVMDGYHGLDSLSATAFTDDGWLRTGDCGDIDADGFLTVTGRIKDMFKTSGGKYVVPTAIEAKFVALCPYVSQFLVFGESRRYCVALIALDPRGHRRVGQQPRPRRGRLRPTEGGTSGPRSHRQLRLAAQSRSQQLGDHQEMGDSQPGSVRGDRRTHAVSESQAPPSSSHGTANCWSPCTSDTALRSADLRRQERKPQSSVSQAGGSERPGAVAGGPGDPAAPAC